MDSLVEVRPVLRYPSFRRGKLRRR